jgi:hypothetical protein
VPRFCEAAGGSFAEIAAAVAVPNAADQPVVVTSRELRVWPQKNLLIELVFPLQLVNPRLPARK